MNGRVGHYILAPQTVLGGDDGGQAATKADDGAKYGLDLESS